MISAIEVFTVKRGRTFIVKVGKGTLPLSTIIFLRKIVKGGTDESYGVHVAKLAGVPKVVTQRANEILKKIERKNVLVNKNSEKENKKQVDGQLDMYNFKLAEIAHELDKVNINELTPIDALNTLVKIKEELK